VAQDRLSEKRLMEELGIAVPAFAAVEALSDIYSRSPAPAGRQSLKTRRLGYDGKGQAVIGAGDDPVSCWRAIGESPAILEAFISFRREISIVLARARDGDMRAWDVTENRHKAGILDTSTVPADITPGLAARAIATAEQIAAALDHVGVLAVEMFVLGDGDDARLMVNEIARGSTIPGHWTADAALTSQFEQHIRQSAAGRLAIPGRHSDVVMTNLIRRGRRPLAELAAEPGARLHLYGKAEAHPGRKMATSIGCGQRKKLNKTAAGAAGGF